MSRWPMLLLILCALALGLVACGGDDDSGDDAATILRETFGEGQEVESGRLDLSFRLNAEGLEGLNGPLGVQLSGPFASTEPTELPRFDFTASLDVNGQQLRAGAVSTGEKGFLRFQDQAYAVSDELYAQFREGYAEQARCNEQRDGEAQTFSALGVQPATWLKDAEKAGEEKIGGADTTRISGQIDVPRFLEDVNRILSRTSPQQADGCAEEGEPEQGADQARQLSEQERKQIAEAITSARVDVWSGDEDRTLRRINVTLAFEVPEGQRADAGGLQRGDIRFDMTLADLNEEQDIKAPADAQPLDDLIAQLGGQVPGLGGAGGAGGEGQGGGAATGGSEYERCLAEAGSDVKKLQECADLLGQ